MLSIFRVFVFAELTVVFILGYRVNRDVCNKNEKLSNDALLGHCYEFDNPNSPLMQGRNGDAESAELADPALDKYFYKWGREEEPTAHGIPGLEEESVALPSLPIFNVLKEDEEPLVDDDQFNVDIAWNLDEVSKLTHQNDVPHVLKSIDERRILDDQVPQISDQMEVESELMQETNDMLNSELGEAYFNANLASVEHVTEIPVVIITNNTISKDKISPSTANDTNVTNNTTEAPTDNALNADLTDSPIDESLIWTNSSEESTVYETLLDIVEDSFDSEEGTFTTSKDITSENKESTTVKTETETDSTVKMVDSSATVKNDTKIKTGEQEKSSLIGIINAL